MPASPFSRLASLIVSLILALGVAACGGDDDEPQPQASESDSEATTPEAAEGGGTGVEASTEIVGGTSVLKVDSGLRRVLEIAGVDIAPVGEASEVSGGIALPIEGGELDIDTPSGTIRHAGGIEFAAAGQSVEATDLELSAQDGAVSAHVDGERVELFSADIGEPLVPPTGDVVVLPATLGFGEQGVQTLNDALGVELFEGDLPFGRLTVDAQRP